MTPLPILLPAHPSCTECELHSGARNPGVPSVHLPESLPFSRTTPVVAVLGMNPGLQEDRTNTPFVGPSGRLLREVYLKHITPHATVFLLNTARCYTHSSSPPKPRHFRACFTSHSSLDLTTIAGDLAIDTPRLLLCCGAHALTTVTKFCSARSWPLSTGFTRQGTPTHLWGDWSLFTTFHPAAVLRDANLMHPVSDHMTLLHSALTGQMPVASSPSIVPPYLPPEDPDVHRKV
jgi:uracil-DNA glycosylase family 4